MAKLTYLAIESLDGYVADEDGKFGWGEPDEEVHTFVNDLARPVGTYLLGRRMYEVLVAWETLAVGDQPPYIRDFAEIWRAADKIVYSKTLETASSARTRIERDFNPEAVRQLKASAGRDLTVATRAHRPRIRGRVGRRVAPVRRARRRGRRHTVPPGQCPLEPRTAGRAAFRQRHGSPSLPHQDVRSARGRVRNQASRRR